MRLLILTDIITIMIKDAKNLPLFQIGILIVSFVLSSGDNYRFIGWLLALEIIYFVVQTYIKGDPIDTPESLLRKEALRTAKIFLSPYTDIWKNLKLSNKYCSLRLGSTPFEIHAVEKVAPYREFYISESKVHSYENLWNMFCKSFTHNVTYDGLVELCRTFKTVITETVSASAEYHSEYQNPTRVEGDYALKPIEDQLDTRKPRTEPLYMKYKDVNKSSKLDINNCSEIELTELPGISIVMAKKAIKKREEIGGFKSIDDFMLYLRLKPHMQEQIKDKIVANKKKGSIVEQRSSERQIDF